MSGVESSSPFTIKIASNKLKSIFWLIKESSNFEIYFSPLYVGIIALIPSLILFILCQKYFIEGVSLTGGKDV